MNCGLSPDASGTIVVRFTPSDGTVQA